MTVSTCTCKLLLHDRKKQPCTSIAQWVSPKQSRQKVTLIYDEKIIRISFESLSHKLIISSEMLYSSFCSLIILNSTKLLLDDSGWSDKGYLRWPILWCC
jgi:hypothetical protein